MQLDPNFNGIFLLSAYFAQRKRFKCILDLDMKKNDSCPNNCQNKELVPEFLGRAISPTFRSSYKNLYACLITVNTEVKGLSSPVVVALPRIDIPNQVIPPNVKPVYWQEGESHWSTAGCDLVDTVEMRNQNLSVMQCDHMTSYTLLQV